MTLSAKSIHSASLGVTHTRAPRPAQVPMMRLSKQGMGTSLAQALNFWLLACIIRLSDFVQFDPLTHLAYEQPSHRHSLTELGLDPSARDNKSDAVAVTDLAYTEPFRLLSDAGVQASALPASAQKFASDVYKSNE